MINGLQTIASFINKEHGAFIFLSKEQDRELNEMLKKMNLDEIAHYSIPKKKIGEGGNKTLELGFRSVFVDGVNLHFGSIDKYINLLNQIESQQILLNRLISNLPPDKTIITKS